MKSTPVIAFLSFAATVFSFDPLPIPPGSQSWCEPSPPPKEGTTPDPYATGFCKLIHPDGLYHETVFGVLEVEAWVFHVNINKLPSYSFPNPNGHTVANPVSILRSFHNINYTWRRKGDGQMSTSSPKSIHDFPFQIIFQNPVCFPILPSHPCCGPSPNKRLAADVPEGYFDRKTPAWTEQHISTDIDLAISSHNTYTSSPPHPPRKKEPTHANLSLQAIHTLVTRTAHRRLRTTSAREETEKSRNSTKE
ncbi:hypothetical protein E6O75_ATG08364 [Venturia nashicola]|uniref:Uncharacterized protein n=1 Tax=Venturia nashicola TaxID=86259 RepID=A0A4Z1NK26_9PEZI|nr:hypothetical protein E6O75_ATG08364 [Venturia nashicola]